MPLSRSDFISFMSAYNIRSLASLPQGEFAPIVDSKGYLAHTLGKISQIFPSSPSRSYGADVWAAIVKKMETGYKNVSKRSLFVGYKTASKIGIALGITSMREWQDMHRSYFRPQHIPLPSSPSITYRENWEGWATFLNNGRVTEFISYAEARAIIHTLGIKTTPEFKAYIQSPMAHPQIPKRPDQVYKEWDTWIDFLAPKFVSYEKARSILSKLSIPGTNGLRLCSEGDFRDMDRPRFIPSHPATYYKDEFVSWSHFLGWKDEFERDVYAIKHLGRVKTNNSPISASKKPFISRLKREVRANDLSKQMAEAGLMNEPDGEARPMSEKEKMRERLAARRKKAKAQEKALKLAEKEDSKKAAKKRPTAAA